MASYSIFITPDNGQTEIEVIVPNTFLAPRVAVGDEVEEFEALTDAIAILDEINSPDWWETSLGLQQYVSEDFDLTKISLSRAVFLKSLLRHFNIGIRIKEFNQQLDGLNFEDLEKASKLTRTAARFLEILRPLFTQFALLGEIEWEEGNDSDDFTATDDSFGAEVRVKMHQTIADNHVNHLFPPTLGLHPSAAFNDFPSYFASGAGAKPYNLDSDHIGLTEGLTVSFSSGGGPFINNESAAADSFRDTNLPDVVPPEVVIVPDAGKYVEPFFAVISSNEAATIIYTDDDTEPLFEDPGVQEQNGFRVTDKIYIPSGITTLRFKAKDASGNISTEFIVDYEVEPAIDETLPTPNPTLDFDVGQDPEKGSRSILLTNADPTVRVWFTVDGSDPTDITFTDDHRRRLNGLKLVLNGATSLRLNDAAIPVDFPRGRGTINLDGQGTGFQVAAKPFRRLFAYAEREREGRWRVNFKSFNTVLQPNNDNRLLIGFAVSDGRGEFTSESIVNVVDTLASQEMVRDEEFLAEAPLGAIVPLNEPNPIELPSAEGASILRYFSRSELTGLYDPPKLFEYEFDTTPPKTALDFAITGAPFEKTLVVNIVSLDQENDPVENLTIYWSTETTTPEPFTFAFQDKLQDPVNDRFLSIQNPNPNKIRPNVDTFDITFSRIDILGRRIELQTTSDLKNQEELDIPVIPNAFFDVAVVPDFEFPTKWRFEVGDANTPVVEATDRIHVARIFTDENGVFDVETDPETPLGNFDLAAASSQPQVVTRKTSKFIEPINLDISAPDYQIVFSWFAVDSEGNTEAVQRQTFKSTQ